jgi:L-amino acid N-acyltransferase YncA
MIRNASPADIEDIVVVYNEAVLEGRLTGDLEPVSIEDRRTWYFEHQGRYAIFVKVVGGTVVGYAAISPYRKGRNAFHETCEISYYLSRQHRSKGFGRELIDYAIEQARNSGFRLILAMILECNQRSIDVLAGAGFSILGRLPNAARIGEEYFDHFYLFRDLRP